ncbi:MAG: gliding motility-associated C-terminal domain-containing protein [Bacteroidales bacterium]|jgi:gliding motility-associated-like protein|nr:gliding motility-associated C-terminal domain-containing protein [Bacteroidales bacterium]MDD4213792.1 gliding motility-associated C-terminal domain-containing protein [Bacteroidales bacterium]
MVIKQVILVISLALAFPYYGKCQCIFTNLIKNPGLEEYTCCPTNMTMIDCANNWTQPIFNNSTSDYFNICGIDSITDYSTFVYFQHAFFGNGYAGICSYNYNAPWSNREYLQGTLTEPLLANMCYYCEFWVKLFNFTSSSTFPLCAIDALSIFFSDTLPKSNGTMALYFPAQINNPTGRIISDTSNWAKISGTFIATGEEKFITVGTFKQENEINKIYYGNPAADRSYYFFDNFSLCPCADTIPPAEPEPVVYIPNIFSPNGDGNNDVLYVRSEHIKELNFSIYNRWGEKVFESQNKNDGWDGNYKGKPCSVDVYVYHATIVFEDGTETSRKGNVTLVR